MSDDPRKTGRGERSQQWVSHTIILRRSQTWQPATDAYETPTHFIIIVELAGMREGDFTVNLQDRRVIITGRRARPTDEDLVAYHQLEVQYGEFRTEIALPGAVERSGVTATYEDGFLRIKLPRRAQTHAIHVVNIKHDDSE